MPLGTRFYSLRPYPLKNTTLRIRNYTYLLYRCLNHVSILFMLLRT